MELSLRNISILIITIATWLAPLYLPETIHAQNEEESDRSFLSLYKEATERYHREEFDEAIQLGNIIRERYPDEPAGAFGLMTSYQTIMRNYRVRIYESEFDSLLNLSVKLAKKAVKNNKKDGRNYFYLGCAYGSRCVFKARRGEWLEAFRDGSQVQKNFKKAITYSPEFYDSYYGLGLHKYWLSAKSKILRALPFARNNRQQGIEYVKLAVEKGQFLNVDAKYGLAAIYYNEQEFENALEMTDHLYESFPNNPTLLYRRGRIYQKLERWAEAKETFNELDKVLNAAKYQSVSYRVELMYQTAKCQFHLNDMLEAQRLCKKAIDLEKECDFSKEIDGPFEKFSEIKKELFELADKIKSIMISEANNTTNK